jgi:hypothetical protein
MPGSTSRSKTGSTIPLYWSTRAEWEGLLDVAGLETEALYGWFDRRPFDGESREFVWVARPPRVSLYDSIAELYDPWSVSVTEDVASTSRRPSARAHRSSSSRWARAGSRCRPPRPAYA